MGPQTMYLIIAIVLIVLTVPSFRCKTTIEAIHGLMSQVIKDKLFNQVHLPKVAAAAAAAPLAAAPAPAEVAPPAVVAAVAAPVAAAPGAPAVASGAAASQ